MGRRRNSSAMNKLFTWGRRQSMKVKAFLAVTCLLSTLVALKLLIKDHDHFFVAPEAAHFLGIIVLIYKLSSQKTCSVFWSLLPPDDHGISDPVESSLSLSFSTISSSPNGVPQSAGFAIASLQSNILDYPLLALSSPFQHGRCL
nr:serine/threonine-protein kinase MHK-like [Coffea arabica]